MSPEQPLFRGRRPPRAASAPVAPKAPSAPKAAPAPPAPRQLVTVVHRLSGWKLLTWLALTGPPMLELDRFPSSTDVHTNIVAGFVSEDGKTVVAHLPRAGALIETHATQTLPGYFEGDGRLQQQPPPPEFTLILGDGKRVGAKFVGLDASTGLSLLEAGERVLANAVAGDEGHTDDPTVGQRVRLYAPAPLRNAATPADLGVVYFGIGQTDGYLTAVSRASTGKLFEVKARASGVTPAWTGAIAMSDSGSLVGIVAESGAGETQIVPAVKMRGAIERVLAQRASVPQPWLGVRGDDAFKFNLKYWEEYGWKPEVAKPIIQYRQGVLLTSVAPGTPAATAGLRPGDVISRIGGREVRGVEDLSPLLTEAGVGQTVDFTVLRALEFSPVNVPVMLSGTQSPAIATAEAELKAARAGIYALQLEHDAMSAESRPAEAAERLKAEARLKATEDRMREVRTQAAAAEALIAEARRRARGPSTRPSPFDARGGAGGARPLQAVGLEVIGLTPRSAARLRAKGGVLVVSVAPESAAAACGLRVGDVIETIDGQSFTRLEIRKKLSDAGSAPLPLGVVREGQRLGLSLKLGPEFQ